MRRELLAILVEMSAAAAESVRLVSGDQSSRQLNWTQLLVVTHLLDSNVLLTSGHSKKLTSETSLSSFIHPSSLC